MLAARTVAQASLFKNVISRAWNYTTAGIKSRNILLCGMVRQNLHIGKFIALRSKIIAELAVPHLWALCISQTFENLKEHQIFTTFETY